MALIRFKPLVGPYYFTLDFTTKTELSKVVEPIVLRHVLSGKKWETLFSSASAMAVASGIDFVIQTTFDPSRASRLFKKHLTPDALMNKAAAKGLALQWEDCVFVLLCLAKVGVLGYDPTFSLRDCIEIDSEKRYPSLDTLVQLGNAQRFLENEFYPAIISAISKANTHVNDGVITEEGKMRTYYMGTDIPSQIISEFHVAWKRIAVRAANGTLSNDYDADSQVAQLKACMAQRFLDLKEWQSKYGQWSNSLLKLFDYTNLTFPFMYEKKLDSITGKERWTGVSVESLRTAVTSVAAIAEGSLTSGAASLLDYIGSKRPYLEITDGVHEVGRLAPFTRLASKSATLPSYDARPYNANPVVAISEVTPTLYGQQFLTSAPVTAGISGLIKDAHNSIVSMYNELKQLYVCADAPFTKREFLDELTAKAVKDLDPQIMLDAALDSAAEVVPAVDYGQVRISAAFEGDVAATLAAMGFTGFSGHFTFSMLDDLFTASATDDRFTAVEREPFYGVPLGDEIPFVNTIKNSLISKYSLLKVINPDDFRISIVLPKIVGRKSVHAAQLLANYGISKPTIFLAEYNFEKQAEHLGSALTALWTPSSLISEDTDDLIMGAAMAINQKAYPLFGDWISNQLHTQHSAQHYTFASHAEQNRFRMCEVMSAARAYISLINLFSPATATTLLWIMRTAGARAAANYFNIYLEKGAK